MNNEKKELPSCPRPNSDGSYSTGAGPTGDGFWYRDNKNPTCTGGIVMPGDPAKEVRPPSPGHPKYKM